MIRSITKVIDKLLQWYAMKQIDSTNEYNSSNRFLPGTILKFTKWGRYSICNKRCVISRARIGNYCQISHHVTISPRDHIYTNFSVHDGIYRRTNEHLYSLGIWDDQYLVRIGNDVWIGCYVVIMPGVEIGNGAIVAAGSIVTKAVPPYAIVAGNPAKIIRYRFTKEQIAELERIRWYEWDIDKVIENKSRLEGIVNFDLDNFKAAQMTKKPLMQEKQQ